VTTQKVIDNIGLPRKLMLSIEETMFATGLSRTEIYDLFAALELPFVKIGKRRLVALEDLQEFVRRHRHLEKPERRQKTLMKRYADAQRVEAQRASVPASGPVTTAAD
jgi:excisionase family DNA binding protein